MDFLNHRAKTTEELKRCDQASCLITYSLKLHEINREKWREVGFAL